MKRLLMAFRLVTATSGIGSKMALLAYFVRSGVRSVVQRKGRAGRVGRTLRIRVQGTDFEVMTESSQLGGIHDVWLGREYDAFPGFRAEPGSVVVDIGANVGAYALWQWKNMGGSRHPESVVAAVEAAPRTAHRLRRNVALNGASSVVRVVEVAIWSTAGDVEFLDSARQSSTAGIASTANRDLLENPTSLIVSSITLDDLCERVGIGDRKIAILKLDVEGAELQIIRASIDALERVQRVVVEADAEAWPKIHDELLSRRFDCVGRRRSVGYFVASRS